MLKYHPHIQHIYLGFGFHSLSSYYDEFIDGDLSGTVSEKYFFLLPIQEQLMAFWINKKQLGPFTKNVLKYGIYNLIFPKKTYLGGFENNFKNVQQDSITTCKRIQHQFYSEQTLRPFSQINMDYLQRIQQLCDAHQIDLTLISTPLHHSYFEHVPVVYQQGFLNVIQQYHFSHISLQNFHSDSANYFIPDGDHVSAEGANVLSQEIFRLIQHK